MNAPVLLQLYKIEEPAAETHCPLEQAAVREVPLQSFEVVQIVTVNFEDGDDEDEGDEGDDWAETAVVVAAD